MRILLVEDELLIAEMLKAMLQDLGHEVLGIAKNYDKALWLLTVNQNIDVCFLDINLQNEKSGFDVAQFINEVHQIPIVFLTSYSDKKTISESMAYYPLGYLLKPFTETDLYTSLELVTSRKLFVQNNVPKTFVFKDGTANIKLQLDEILYLKSDNIYVEIKTKTKIYLIRTSLTKMLEDINNENMIRVHRTYAVNVNHIKSIAGENILIADEKIPLSRLHKDELMSKFRG
jgi:two-component system, LytTR family, response regulator LytT